MSRRLRWNVRFGGNRPFAGGRLHGKRRFDVSICRYGVVHDFGLHGQNWWLYTTQFLAWYDCDSGTIDVDKEPTNLVVVGISAGTPALVAKACNGGGVASSGGYTTCLESLNPTGPNQTA